MKNEVEKVNKIKVGKFISSIRKNKGLVQQDIANYTGASFKTVSKWENGYAFPDVKYQRKLCEILEITTEELQIGEYNNKKRKQAKHKDLIFKIAILVLVILIPVVVFLASYFTLTYNTQKIFMLYVNENKDFFIQGMLIDNSRYSSIYLGSPDFGNYKVKGDDQISIDLYSNDILIYHANDSKYLNANFNNDDIDTNNLKVIITIQPYKKDPIIYEEKISVNEYSKDQVVQSISSQKSSNEDIVSRLISNGYIKDDEGSYKKIDKTSQCVYYVEMARLNCTYESGKTAYSIIYYLSLKYADVLVYENSKGTRIMLEQYRYYSADDKIDCRIGRCASLNDAKKLIENYETLLMGE